LLGARSTEACIVGGLERRGAWRRAFVVEPLDALLGLVEGLGQTLREPHAFLVARQRLLERQLAAFELLDDDLETLERGFEALRLLGFGSRRRRLLIGHVPLPCGSPRPAPRRRRERTRLGSGRPPRDPRRFAAAYRR